MAGCNVAVSQAHCASILVGAPRTSEPNCCTPEQMRMANALCAHLERALSVVQRAIFRAQEIRGRRLLI